MLSSGIADWWGEIAPFPTFEGVNVVMFQQSARLLLKHAKKLAAGKKPVDFFNYLARDSELLEAATQNEISVAKFLDHQFLEDTLAYRASYSVKEVLQLMNDTPGSNKEKENETLALDINRMSRLHIIYVIYKISR